jgi:hypothetical protein
MGYMATLDEKRVELFYEKLTGEKPDRRGGWKIEQHNIAQKIVYIEEACRSVLLIINSIEHASPDDRETVHKLVKELRAEFRFLDTLRDTRGDL